MKTPIIQDMTKEDFLAETKENYHSIDMDILKAHTLKEVDITQKAMDEKLITKGGSSSNVKAAKLRELSRIIKGVSDLS